MNQAFSAGRSRVRLTSICALLTLAVWLATQLTSAATENFPHAEQGIDKTQERVVAADPVSDSLRPVTDSERAIIEQELHEAWMRRAEQVRRLRLEWENLVTVTREVHREVPLGGTWNPNEEPVQEFRIERYREHFSFIQDERRCRLDRTGKEIHGGRRYEIREIVMSTENGFHSFQDQNGKLLLPLLRESLHIELSWFPDPTILPILAYVAPTETLTRNQRDARGGFPEFMVLFGPESQMRADEKFLDVTRKNPFSDSSSTFRFDRARDYHLTSMISTWPEIRNNSHLQIDYEHLGQEEGYVPSSWTQAEQVPHNREFEPMVVTEGRMLISDLDPQIEEEEIAFSPPPGTIVETMRALPGTNLSLPTSRSVVLTDGSLHPLTGREGGYTYKQLKEIVWPTEPEPEADAPVRLPWPIGIAVAAGALVGLLVIIRLVRGSSS